MPIRREYEMLQSLSRDADSSFFSLSCFGKKRAVCVSSGECFWVQLRSSMNRLLNYRLCTAVAVSLLAGLAGASGCAQILEDVQVQETSTVESNQPGGSDSDAAGGSPGVLGAGGSGDEGSCRPGSQRCSGSVLEACLISGTEFSKSKWVAQQDCQSVALCDAEAGLCVGRACGAGEVKCDGLTARKCNEDQTVWDNVGDCQSVAHCSTIDSDCPEGAPCCLAVPCDAGQLRCSSGEMQRCNDSQTDWELMDACVTADLCQGGLAACGSDGADCACQAPECVVGETRCNGTNFERCNIAQTGWDLVESCASVALCTEGLTVTPQRCEDPTCDVGEFSCSGAGVLQICSADRTGFDDQSDCEGAAFCNFEAGRCEDIPCELGEQRCNGAQIQICREDREGFRDLGQACATPQLCNNSNPGILRCDPPQCEVGEFRCDVAGGTQLSRCNSGRTGFETQGGACPRADLCSTERRRCDFCVPSRRECNINRTAIRTCSANGNFFGAESACPLGCIPDTGSCVTCQRNSFACNGNTLTRCDDGISRTSLNRREICNGAEQLRCVNGNLLRTNCGFNGCSQARSACNECGGQQRRCVGDGFQQCQGGFFGPIQNCGAGLSCGGQGQCGCDRFQLRCAGDSLLECNFNGSAFVAADRCDDEVLRTCDDGVLDEDICQSAPLCEASLGSECLELDLEL